MRLLKGTWRMRLAAVCTVVAAAMAAEVRADTPNPYGVAGWGVLGTLGMPAGCLDYDWNGLHPGTLVQMCRPNHYYNYIGIAVRWWGYNEQTEQINDPTQFSAWVTANPGRVWIIGNEPDLASQDGLTREQYARMYKTYHDFIIARDPTARFCIAGITGGSTADRLGYTTSWYQYVLDYYLAAFGAPMPIDIWNVHSYCGPLQVENPDQPINDFVTPFVNWCHTVDGGRYASREVWITELPVGEWIGALSEDWIIWFAQRYLPRLERAGISRWFWFVSSDNSEWATVALVKSGVSPLGRAYAALAAGYPNAIIPVTPYVPAPAPALFQDDFSVSGPAAPWMVKAGHWAVENGALRQSRVDYPWVGESCVLQHVYGDLNLRLRMRVNAATNPLNWAGIVLHAPTRFDSHGTGGYLVFLRRNGAIGLNNRFDGTVREVAGVVADAAQWQDVRVQTAGWRTQVWANDSLIIDYVDPQHRFASGYTLLQVYKTDSSYDDVRIWNAANAPPVLGPVSLGSARLTADGQWPYALTLNASDADGQIATLRALLDDGTYGSEHGRGCLAWATSDAELLRDGGAWTLMGDAAGGGRWAWRADGWGADTYLRPLGASTAVAGNQRQVTFTFAARPAWAPAANQAVRSWARDTQGDVVGWTLSPTRFRVAAHPPADLDGDDDVDQSDFGRVQLCLTPSGIAQPAPECLEARIDGDDDVDMGDVTAFLTCLSGAGVPASPGCVP